MNDRAHDQSNDHANEIHSHDRLKRLLYTVNEIGEFSGQKRCAVVRLSIVYIESRIISDQLLYLLATAEYWRLLSLTCLTFLQLL